MRVRVDSGASSARLYWHELDRGGHFAAFEQPALLVDEVRSFIRLVRWPGRC